MMEFKFLFALLSPILIGWLSLHLILPNFGSSNRLPGIFWTLFLGTGLGLALISLLYYSWSVVFDPAAYFTVLMLIELLLVAALFVTCVRRKRSRTDQESSFLPRGGVNKLLAAAATLLLILLFVNYFEDWVRVTLAAPYGDWDAWAIWNLRAGFIASGESWSFGFSEAISWSHPDYPLLLPLNIARLWVILGDRSVWAPILVSFMFQISLLGFLITSVHLLRGYIQGILAGMVGVLVLFTSLSFKLYADIPIAFFFLAANCLVFLSESGSHAKYNFSLLAGLLVGAGLWTKNEGWAILAATVITKLILDFSNRKSISWSKKWWGYFLLGIAPFLLVTIHFNIVYAPPGDLLKDISMAGITSSVLSPGRYMLIFRFVRDQFLEYGNLILPLVPMMLIYALIAGFSIPVDQKKAVLSLALRITLLAGFYFLVYLITPKDLAWHLGTSLERLVTHIFPSFILLFFLVVSPPGREEPVLA
jgi:hypothetical protein